MNDLLHQLRVAGPSWDGLPGEAADEIERLTAERDALRADAERWRWQREHGAWMVRCETERRGYRGTTPTPRFEVWYEFDGWLASTMRTLDDPFPTMDAAIDAAMKETP